MGAWKKDLVYVTVITAALIANLFYQRVEAPPAPAPIATSKAVTDASRATAQLARETPDDAQAAAIMAELDRLRAELDNLRAERMEQASAQLPEPATEAHVDVYASLASKFSAEGHDPEWALGDASHVTALVSDTGLTDSQLDSVDCRATLCKLVLTRDNEFSDEDTHMKLAMALGGSFPSMTAFDVVADDRVETIVYLDRATTTDTSARGH